MHSQSVDRSSRDRPFTPIRNLISRRTPSRVRPRNIRVNTSEFPTVSLDTPSNGGQGRRHSTLKKKITTLSIDMNTASQTIPKRSLQPVTCSNESAVVQYFRRLLRQKAGFQFASSTRQNKRPYNEDRIVCITNMEKPFRFEQLSNKTGRRSFFAIIDGHGGAVCADYLVQNLHQYVCNWLIQVARERDLEKETCRSLKRAFEKIEKSFIQGASQAPKPETSGACVIACLLLEEVAYIANVGDCHGVMLKKNSEIPQDINVDHKPSNKAQYQRIITNGGKLVKQPTRKPSSLMINRKHHETHSYRIQPGSLNVSRTIGDVEAKLRKFGGLPGVISPEPDIYSLMVKDLEYLVMGSTTFVELGDGLFDGLSKFDVHRIYRAVRKLELVQKEMADEFVKRLMDQAVQRTSDNVSALVVIFKK